MIAKRFLSALMAFTAATAFASAAAQTESPGDVDAIVSRIQARNPSLQSFQARVRVNIRQTNFPWLAPKLDGTAYFKRPDNYEVVFDRVPSYAKGINKLFGNVTDPSSWRADSNIAYDGIQKIDGRQFYVLRLTKKIYSDQLKDSYAYVDTATYQVARMEFHYANGGDITMTQVYRNQGPFNVLSSQHAEIHIPHIRAVADASFGVYQTNVAVDDSVFTRK